MKKSALFLAFLLAAPSISGCMQKTGPGALELGSEAPAQKTMEQVALTANRCWFKSGDKAFLSYHLAPELNSYSGRPRILVVPSSNPAAKPLLVIEAEGSPAQVRLYGVLMTKVVGNRIADDVDRWIKGDNEC